MLGAGVAPWRCVHSEGGHSSDACICRGGIRNGRCVQLQVLMPYRYNAGSREAMGGCCTARTCRAPLRAGPQHNGHGGPHPLLAGVGFGGDERLPRSRERCVGV